MEQICPRPNKVARLVFEQAGELGGVNGGAQVAISFDNAFLAEGEEEVGEWVNLSVERFGVPMFRWLKLTGLYKAKVGNCMRHKGVLSDEQ